MVLEESTRTVFCIVFERCLVCLCVEKRWRSPLSAAVLFNMSAFGPAHVLAVHGVHVSCVGVHASLVHVLYLAHVSSLSRIRGASPIPQSGLFVIDFHAASLLSVVPLLPSRLCPCCRRSPTPVVRRAQKTHRTPCRPEPEERLVRSRGVRALIVLWGQARMTARAALTVPIRQRVL